MDPNLIASNEKTRAPKTPFRVREFWRVVALAWPYRTSISLGLLATIVFAVLHTASIAGVFPIFKTLLEDEGVKGWADRYIAGARVGVVFLPPTAEEGTDSAVKRLQLQSVRSQSSAHEQGFRDFDLIEDERGRSASMLLNAIAVAEVGDEFRVNVFSAEQVPEETPPKLTLVAGELDTQDRLLRWGASLLPADVSDNKLRTLAYILVVLITATIIANVFRYIGEVTIARAILRTMMDLRGVLYARTLQLPMRFFAGQPTADIVTRFVQDIQEIQRGLLTLFGKFIREPLRAALILGCAFLFDWRITLLMVVVAPVTVVVFWTIGRRVKKANSKLLRAYGVMIGALTASLQNLRVVKTYSAEDHERKLLRGIDLRMFKQQLRLAKLQAFTSPMMETVALVAVSAGTVWLASRVLSHDLPPARFMTLGFILSTLFDPLRKLSDVYVRVKRSTAGAERIFQVIDEPIEGGDDEGKHEFQPLSGNIEYENVTFTYPGAETPALSHVSFSISQGECVAIVGPNGCGKTTLVSLLPRLYDPDKGTIRYDGVDLCDGTLASLRKQVGIVSQDAVVFAGTPAENIAYGRLPDDERTRMAACRASADEFIQEIPGGYEASLGERGTTLSGGQRQRLAIARAIFHDAPILIFDEATSQVDSESELKIQQAIREFAKVRTTLIIAHRLSTIQFADRIIVMEAGRIIDTGTHRELFNHCTLYRTLCQTQLVEDADPPETPGNCS